MNEYRILVRKSTTIFPELKVRKTYDVQIKRKFLFWEYWMDYKIWDAMYDCKMPIYYDNIKDAKKVLKYLRK